MSNIKILPSGGVRAPTEKAAGEALGYNEEHFAAPQCVELSDAEHCSKLNEQNRANTHSRA